ncbi:hypothetical protein EJB05_17950, partial [Eragrostis curvula]
MGSPLRTVHIRRSSSSSPGEAAAAIVVDGRAGVDLARVGLALGLDPASVRLNGYFLSRGPGHVSSAVTWRSLLAFFAAKGLPTGADAATPIAVHGKPAAAPALPSGSALRLSLFLRTLYSVMTLFCIGHWSLLISDTSLDPTTQVSTKRKSRMEAERCTKKRSEENRSSPLSKTTYDQLSDEIVLGLKRRLRLEDSSPAKKIKQGKCSSDAQQPVKFSCNFVNGNGKRPLDEEMIASLSCKRVR